MLLLENNETREVANCYYTIVSYYIRACLREIDCQITMFRDESPSGASQKRE